MSKQSMPILTDTIRCAGTIAAHRFVTTGALQAGADANAIGVSRFAGVSGELISVDTKGTTVVESGAAIAAGATIKSDASGRAITWATSGGKLGIAKEAATAAGQFIEMTLIDNVA